METSLRVALHYLQLTNDPQEWWDECFPSTPHPDTSGFPDQINLLFLSFCSTQYHSLSHFTRPPPGYPPTFNEVTQFWNVNAHRSQGIEAWKRRWIIDEWIYALFCLLLEGDEDGGIPASEVIGRIEWNGCNAVGFEEWKAQNSGWIATGYGLRHSFRRY